MMLLVCIGAPKDPLIVKAFKISLKFLKFSPN